MIWPAGRVQCARLFEGGLRLVDPVETAQRDAFEAMNFRLPLAVTCFFLRLSPLARRGKRGSMFTLAHKCVCQAGKPVQTKSLST